MALTVILPTLDERDNVARTARGLLEALPDLAALIVVDDGSTDGTRETVRELSARDARVKLLARDRDPGLVASLLAGLAAADTERVGWLDADGVIDPHDFARVAACVEAGADVAIASRYRAGGRVKPLRHNPRDLALVTALSWLLNVVIVPALTGLGVHDYTSGIIVLRRSALSGLPLTGDHGEYFVGLLCAALAAGLRVEEVGYVPRRRTSGRSKTAPDLARLVQRGFGYLGAAARARAG